MNKSGIIRSAAGQITYICVSSAAAFLYTPFLLKNIGSSGYAYYSLSLILLQLAAVVSAAFSSMLSVFTARELKEGNVKGISILFSSSFRGNAMASVAVILPAALITVFSDRIFSVPERLELSVRLLFVFVTCAGVLSLMRSTFTAASTATENRWLISFSKAVEKTVSSTLPFLFFAVFSPSVFWVGVAILCGAGVRLYLSFRSSKRLIPGLEVSGKLVKRDAASRLLAAGWWNCVIQLIFLLSVSLSVPLANFLYGTEMQAEYSLAAIIPGNMRTLSLLGLNWLLPVIGILFERGDYDSVRKKLPGAMRIFSVVSGIFAALLVGFGDIFLKLWIPVYYTDEIYYITVIHGISLCITFPFGLIYGILVSRGKVKAPAIFMLITLALSVFASVILKTVNPGEVLGVAFSLLMAGAVQFPVFMTLYFCRKTGMKPREIYTPWLKGLLPGGAGIIMAFLIRASFSIFGYGDLLGAIVFEVAVLLAVGILLFRKDIEIIKSIGRI